MPKTPVHYKFWPKRLPKSLVIPEVSLFDNLETSARRYPNRTALVFFGTCISYRELLQKAERVAAFLQGLGVKKGDRVMLAMQNCPQLVIAHFGILRANAVVVPVNPMNRAEELKHYISDPVARVAITTADLAAEIAKASDALPGAEPWWPQGWWKIMDMRIGIIPIPVFVVLFGSM